MSEKQKHYIILSTVFLVVFLLSFSIFGGFTKVKHLLSVKKNKEETTIQQETKITETTAEDKNSQEILADTKDLQSKDLAIDDKNNVSDKTDIVTTKEITDTSDTNLKNINTESKVDGSETKTIDTTKVETASSEKSNNKEELNNKNLSDLDKIFLGINPENTSNNTTDTKNISSEEAIKNNTVKNIDIGEIKHTVKSNDTLESIAKILGYNVSDLKYLNNGIDTIKEGDSIVIIKNGWEQITVSSSDTWENISKKYSISKEKILFINDNKEISNMTSIYVPIR